MIELSKRKLPVIVSEEVPTERADGKPIHAILVSTLASARALLQDDCPDLQPEHFPFFAVHPSNRTRFSEHVTIQELPGGAVSVGSTWPVSEDYPKGFVNTSLGVPWPSDDGD